MNRLLLGCLVALFMASSVATGLGASSLTATRLRCEHRENPTGVDRPTPRLSWIVQSDERDQQQTAYQIIVASTEAAARSGKGDLWDSGKVASSNTLGVPYKGKALQPHGACYWAVRVWDAAGEASELSEPALWTVGLLSSADWEGEWIGYDAPREANPKLPPTRLLRVEFPINKPVKRAIAYVTALGLPEVWLNGQRLTDDYFLPGWTDYDTRVYYRAYDATELLQQGTNAAGVELADGWFAGHAGLPVKTSGRDRYGKSPRFAGQLFIEYADGSTETLASGEGWRAATGGTLEADFFMGQSYDARLAPVGWTKPGFDDSEWVYADTGCEIDPLVEWHPGPPVREIEEFEPVSIT